MKAKKYIIRTISLVLLLLLFSGVMVIVIDPFFHYHAPLSGIKYRMREERYTNPGIAAHFEYDTIITGTSMSRNVMPSRVDEALRCKSVKMPIPGAQVGDIGDLIKYAYSKHESNIVNVVVSLDVDRLNVDSANRNDSALPHYLYDDNPVNDINYLLNKSVLAHDVLGNIIETIKGGEGTSLDKYGSYEADTGKIEVLNKYNRISVPYDLNSQKSFTDEDIDRTEDNIRENYISIIEAHPETTFYFYIPPYSVVYWDDVIRDGEMERQFRAWEVALNQLLEYDNVKVYDFYDRTDIIENLDNYYDSIHFNADISNQIVEWIGTDDFRIEKDEVHEKLLGHREWLEQFDYDALFEIEE